MLNLSTLLLAAGKAAPHVGWAEGGECSVGEGSMLYLSTLLLAAGKTAPHLGWGEGVSVYRRRDHALPLYSPLGCRQDCSSCRVG